MMQLTPRNKDSSLPEFVDHSNIDSASFMFQFRQVSRSIIHILIWRVTNHFTELDVISIRSLISQKCSERILARSYFIDIFKVCASNYKVEQPWYLCMPNRRPFGEYFSTITSLRQNTHPIVPKSPHKCHL